MRKKNIIIISLIVILMILSVGIKIYKKNNEPKKYNLDFGSETHFDYKIIKQANTHYKENYMISPLSIAYALSILREGSTDNTKKELDDLLGDYRLLNVVNVKDKISLANALFIKERFKNSVKNEYVSKLTNDYDAGVIIDEFKTPKKINEWVNNKTFNMIKDPIDELPDSFVLGIANAIAIDVEWEQKFENCETRKDSFNLTDGTKLDTAFMHTEDTFEYFETKGAKGIIKDYGIYDYKTGERINRYSSNYDKNNTVELEYIAILPEDLNDYINNFNLEELKNIEKNTTKYDSKTELHMYLPKYKYDFDYSDFEDDLKKLGMIDAFDPNNASFKNISNEQISVSKAIHKSHIEVSEEGTKAAAVTMFLITDGMALADEKEIINIKFDKPFIYLIKEKKSDNIWFFGTVYEPMKWEDNDSVCK